MAESVRVVGCHHFAKRDGASADARAGHGALLASLRARCAPRDAANSSYFTEVRRLRDQRLDQVRERSISNHTPVTISRLMAELRSFLPRDAIVVTSSENTQDHWFQQALVYQPKTSLSAGGYGLSWWMVDGAGCTLAAPDGYTLSRAIAQSDVGALQGGGYTLG
jgi:acetolactate synthase-1/2/3 large subunit